MLPDSTYGFRNRDELEELAQLRGCEAVFADAFTLQLDLDTPDARTQFERRLSLLCEKGFLSPKSVVETWSSRSGNQHVQIHLLESMPAEQRITLQALLGSDPMREILNLYEERQGYGSMVLFRPRST